MFSMEFLPCHSYHHHRCHCCDHCHYHCHDRHCHRCYNPTTVLAPSIAVTTILTSVAFKSSHHSLHSFSFFWKMIKMSTGLLSWTRLNDLAQHSTKCQQGFPGGIEPASQCRKCRRCWFDPWVWKIPSRRAQQCTPVSLPGESHGQRRLAGYSPWRHKEPDTTEAT